MILIWCEKLVLKFSAYGHLELLILVLYCLRHAWILAFFSEKTMKYNKWTFTQFMSIFNIWLPVLYKVRNETESWLVGNSHGELNLLPRTYTKNTLKCWTMRTVFPKKSSMDSRRWDRSTDHWQSCRYSLDQRYHCIYLLIYDSVFNSSCLFNTYSLFVYILTVSFFCRDYVLL